MKKISSMQGLLLNRTYQKMAYIDVTVDQEDDVVVVKSANCMFMWTTSISYN